MLCNHSLCCQLREHPLWYQAPRHQQRIFQIVYAAGWGLHGSGLVLSFFFFIPSTQMCRCSMLPWQLITLLWLCRRHCEQNSYFSIQAFAANVCKFLMMFYFFTCIVYFNNMEFCDIISGRKGRYKT